MSRQSRTLTDSPFGLTTDDIDTRLYRLCVVRSLGPCWDQTHSSYFESQTQQTITVVRWSTRTCCVLFLEYLQISAANVKQAWGRPQRPRQGEIVFRASGVHVLRCPLGERQGFRI